MLTAATTEDRKLSVSGGDWDDVMVAIGAASDNQPDERVIINLGPQHPSSHGVLASIDPVMGGVDR